MNYSNKKTNPISMNFLEVKIYIGFLLSVTWAQFFSSDNLIKTIPAIIVSIYTIYKWYILYQKRKTDKNITE